MSRSKKKSTPTQVERAELLQLAVATLQKILPHLRNDEQGGYDGCKDGKFALGTHADVGHNLRVTTAELDALFEVAGIVPDAIAVNGDCDACVYGSGNPYGPDQGWSPPCCSCARPKMTNFVPLASVEESALRLTDDEAQLLINVRDRVEWWATGIVTPRVYDGSKARERQMVRANDIRASMLAREMVIGSTDARITNKGRRAIRLWQASKRRTAVAS